ncbi:hypothetical protein [Pseudonocardia sp. GCM10023141]|uniref:hypothetical protein n=1 Tax=Pseudonocardia sp. GCM10023141 TaxID=3252653 RepID=UPI00361A1F05
MSALLFGLATAAVGLAAVAIGRLFGRRLWRRQRVESGWEDWRRSAAALPLRDRIALYWANSTGRALTDPRLAALAVQRGESGRAIMDASRRRMVWTFAALAVFWAAFAVVGAFELNILQTATYAVLAVASAATPVLLKVDRRWLQRSIDANRDRATGA